MLEPRWSDSRPLFRTTDFTTDPQDLRWLGQAVGSDESEARQAFDALRHRGLLALGEPAPGSGKRRIAVAAAAARHELPPVQAAVVDHLLGTEREPGHPYIARTEGVCGREPVIRGTGVAAEAVANHFLAGKGVWIVQRDYPHLTEVEILDALHFVLDRRRAERGACAA